MATAIRTAAANGASIMSVSLGACNPAASYQQAKSAFADVSAAGATVFVASGDYGDRAGSKRACGSKIDVVYPGADPSVVAVGGTSLYLNLDDTIAREVAWKDSGGGRVKWMARPLWQKAAMLPKDSNRWAPDVAFLGNMNTGVSAVFNGDWQQAGGTSLGAPAWAAAWALIRQSVTSSGKTIGTAAPLLYKVGNSAKYTQVFHDVTSGTNGHYKAAIGWDPVTGWGTPDVSALADAMQKYAKTPTVTTTPPQTGGL
jgi:subtilase family serine protease